LCCAGCRHRFASEAGIPQLFWPTPGMGGPDVTELVRAFYEDTPFPNYDDIDSPETLRVILIGRKRPRAVLPTERARAAWRS
jgi:hypothetical protein